MKYIQKTVIILIFFTSIITQSQSPGNINTDLTLWLKTDVGTNTTTNGIGITSWSDQSGNSFDATGTGNAVYNTSNLINHNPTISFTNDVRPITGAINRPNGTASTVFVVGNISQVTNRKALVEFGQGGTNRQMFFNNTYSLGVSYTLDTTSNNIWTISDQGGISDTTINQNGLEIASATPRSGNFSTSWTNGNYYLGDDETGGDRLTGEIAEVIYYDSQLSNDDNRRVESYLAIKYGITLDNSLGNDDGDYALSDDTELWDASDNATYHNNIIAIGRDDDSGLAQTKSTDTDDVLTIEKTGSFTNNLDFIITGSNNNPYSFTSTNTPTGILNIAERTWKIQTTGTPGNISISFKLGGDVINTGIATDYNLIMDDDPDFTDVSSTIAGSVIVDDILTFTNVSLSDGDFFTLGNSNITTFPGSVGSGIVSWFKANEGISTDINGTPIATWDNEIGTEQATQAGSSDHPTYQENIHNHNPSVYFANGDNGYFNIDLDAINNSDYNVLAIVERDESITENYFLGTAAFSTNEGLHLGYRDNTHLTLAQWANDLDVEVNGFDTPANSKALIRAELNSSFGKTIQELRDGNFTEATDAVTDFLTGNHQGVIGRGYTNKGFEGYISEIIIYNRTLNNNELDKIYSYLAIKYGMTLNTSDGITNGNYKDSQSNIIWNNSNNSAYHNEVIAIGRDDKSNLNQLKSTEPNSSSIALTIEAVNNFDNQNFVFVGNDGGTIGTTTTGIHPNYLYRVDRTWKTQTTGTTGNVNISFTLGGAITNTGNPYDYAILIDNDTDFSDATVNYQNASINGNILTFTNVNLNNGDIFTLAVESIFEGPGDVIGDLTLWLRADSGTNTTTNGEGLTNWLDQSGQSSNATGTGDAQYKENAFNYNPSIEFFNTAFPIEGTMSRNNGIASTIIMVQKSKTQSSSERDAFGDFNGSSSNRQYFFEDGYGRGGGAYTVSEGNTSILTVDDPGSNNPANIYENGAFLADSNNKNTNSSWSGLGAYQIGDDRTGNNEFTGEIAEVLYYDRELSSAERQKVESYLAIKYGVTLDNSNSGTEGDYVISDNTIIWDAEDNVNYHNDVFGIGRDDNSVLNQLKSKSESSDYFIDIEKLGSFSNDKDFIVIGNNNLNLFPSVDNSSPSYSHSLKRVWNVHTNGTPGSVNISFHLDDQKVYNSETIGDYALLIDTDTDFSSGAVEHTTGASITDGVLTFTNVSLADGDFISLAIEAPIIPMPGAVDTSISLWLKSDLGTNASDTGDGITSWIDQSGNGSNATGTGRAVYDNSEMMNYNPTISFTDDIQPISGNFTRATGTNSTFFVVANIDPDDIIADSNNQTALVEFSSPTYSNNDERQVFFTNRYFNILQLDSDDFEGVKLWTIEDQDASNNSNIYSNNSLIDSYTGTNNKQFTTGQYFIGDDETGNDRLIGNISEVIYYDTSLSAIEKQKVESYLAIKYGITLDNSGGGTNGDYVDSSGTTIWQASANLAYHNDIAIIGQDENSGLYQKQSKSENPDGILTIALGTIAENNIANTNEFDDDLDFLIWGNNGTGNVVSLVDNGSPSGTCSTISKKLDREWKVLNIGSVGSVSLSFDMSTLPNPSDYTLEINGTPFGSAGAVTESELVFTGVTFNNGDTFTLTKNTPVAEIVYFNGAWSGGSGTNNALSTSDSNKSVDIFSDVTLTEDGTCYCMSISSEATLTVPNTQYLEVVNNLDLDGDLYLEGDAELIQAGTDNNSGAGNLYKIINDANDSSFAYTYYSSPVNTSGNFTIDNNLKFNTGATLAENTNPSYTHHSIGDTDTTISTRWTHLLNGSSFVEIDENEAIASGIGFTMKGTGGTDVAYNFIGTPNNGEINVPITSGDFLLTGNPYPSTINIDDFNSNMLASNITDGAVYLWDHTGVTSHSGLSDDDLGSYATIMGGIKTPSAQTGAVTPTEFIRPGQGFIVYGGTSGGNVQFTNALRNNSNITTGHFFKTNKINTLKPIVRLGFEYKKEDGSIFHRQLATALEGSSLEKEVGKDAFMLDSYSNDMFWTIPNEQDRFVITSVPYISDNLELPIGVVVDTNKEVTFKLDAVENISESIYLLDKETATITNLGNNNSYKTILDSGEYQDRFSLVFKENSTLTNNEILDSKTVIYVNEDILTIVLESGKIQEIEIYDLLGKKILYSSTNNVDVSNLPSQVYVTKITTENGIISKKVIL